MTELIYVSYLSVIRMDLRMLPVVNIIHSIHFHF